MGSSTSSGSSSHHTSSGHHSSCGKHHVSVTRPGRSQSPKAKTGTQLFDVTVPAGVHPGQQFKIKAQGQQFLVTCPANAGPGRKIRVPVQATQQQPTHTTHTSTSSYV